MEVQEHLLLQGAEYPSYATAAFKVAAHKVLFIRLLL